MFKKLKKGCGLKCKIIIILIICIILAIVLMFFNKTKEFGPNLITEIFGIIITLFVINEIIESDNIEKNKNTEKNKILNLDRILKGNINKIYTYSLFITNINNEKDFELNENFEFSRMKNFDIMSLLIPDIPKKSVELLHKNIEILKFDLKNALLSINFEFNDELEKLFIDYIFNKNNNIPSFFLNEINRKEELLKLLNEVLEKHLEKEGDVIPKIEDYKSNAFINLILLYHAINFNIKFINKYNNIIKNIKNNN